eukprot:TRINITY_DN318_c0_g1_i2.p1 TRINITY_DN318_c0_g1~~TRINITY_DN318_c0_g1_i2.p1  ORF type:complete len:192 (-),score=20.11 TRINITY_DN318_c0_g1_i2:117-692(-)
MGSTVRKIPRPSAGPRMLYNDRDSVQTLKFQAVYTPDGIIRHLTDAYAGRALNAGIMRECDLDPVLRANMVADGVTYSVYADAAYERRRTPYVMTPYKGNIAPGSWEAFFNGAMVNERVTAASEFGLLRSLWTAENFPTAHELFQCDCGLGQQYVVMAILTNLHTCMYGCKTATYFKLYAPSARAYVAGTH